jgi:hypothetical protein
VRRQGRRTDGAAAGHAAPAGSYGPGVTGTLRNITREGDRP